MLSFDSICGVDKYKYQIVTTIVNWNRELIMHEAQISPQQAEATPSLSNVPSQNKIFVLKKANSIYLKIRDFEMSQDRI